MEDQIKKLVTIINSVLIDKKPELQLDVEHYQLLSRTPSSVSLSVKTFLGNVFLKIYLPYFDDEIIGVNKYERHTASLTNLNKKCLSCAPKLFFHSSLNDQKFSFLMTEHISSKPEKISLEETINLILKVRASGINSLRNILPVNSPLTLMRYVETYLESGKHYLKGVSKTDPALKIIERRASLLKNSFSKMSPAIQQLSNKPSLLSHGDLHKENILSRDNNQLLFIDWDFAALAPLEYDIAMVKENVFPDASLNKVLSLFESVSSNTEISEELVRYYRQALNLINALWAFNVLIRLKPSEVSEDNLFSNPGFLEQYTMDSLKKFDLILFSE